jgi:hypothetical protein
MMLIGPCWNTTDRAKPRFSVQRRAGTRLASSSGFRMSNVFMAGQDVVRWDLTACGADGPYRLTIRHGHGTIVEYFHTVIDALDREAELEELLITARGGRPCSFGKVA